LLLFKSPDSIRIMLGKPQMGVSAGRITRGRRRFRFHLLTRPEIGQVTWFEH
jgi:hypothetical protein